MAMFGNSRLRYAVQPGDMGGNVQEPIEEANAPFIRSTDPVFTQMNPELAAPMPKKRGLFGGAGKVLGGIADVMMYGPFAGQVRQTRAANAEERQFNNAYKMAQVEQMRAKANDPTFQNVEGVGLVRINPDGTTATAVPAQAKPEPTPSIIREMQAMGIDPQSEDGRKYWLMRSSGYGLTPEGIEAAATKAGAIAKATAPFKAASERGGPSKIQATRVVNGAAYYKVNGAWYDNPEGR